MLVADNVERATLVQINQVLLTFRRASILDRYNLNLQLFIYINLSVEISIPARRSEARDRSPRREKETSGVQSKNSSKPHGSSFAVKSENKGDEATQKEETKKVKKDDPVKHGLEELQRLLPHLGSPGEEKVCLTLLGMRVYSWTQVKNYTSYVI